MKQLHLKGLLCLAVMFLFPDICDAQLPTGSGVYVGGHIRRERPNTIKTLKESGFTYVILFNVDVQEDGTLKTDGETICENGEYVFYKTQPNYVDDIRALKTSPTSINRIEICIGGWGNASYGRIKNLINAEGTGVRTMLYKNFKALFDAVPGIDAVNNDQEQDYDVTTAVRFHTMMFDLGRKTTIAPYTNKSYWTSFINQLEAARPGACDRVMIQCYDGGAYNNPSDWHFGDIPLHAGRTNYQSSMEESIAQMQSWHDNNGVTGGFVWVYNDETWNLNKWAIEMNKVYGTLPISANPVATVYNSNSYRGTALDLGVGEYGKGLFALAGMTFTSVFSYRISEGYQLVAYQGDNFDGDPVIVTGEAPRSASTIGFHPTTFKIEPVEETAIKAATVVDGAPSLVYTAADRSLEVTTDRATQLRIYTLSGQQAYVESVDKGHTTLRLPLLLRGVYIVSVGGAQIKISL